MQSKIICSKSLKKTCWGTFVARLSLEFQLELSRITFFGTSNVSFHLRFDHKTTKCRPLVFLRKIKLTHNWISLTQVFCSEVCSVKQISQLLNCYEIWSTSTAIDSLFPNKLVYLLELLSTVLISSEELTPSFFLLRGNFLDVACRALFPIMR